MVRENAYIVTCVIENRISMEICTSRENVPETVEKYLRGYLQKQELTDILEEFDKGERENGEWGCDTKFDEEGKYSAYCYVDENFDIYARPLPSYNDKEMN